MKTINKKMLKLKHTVQSIWLTFEEDGEISIIKLDVVNQLGRAVVQVVNIGEGTVEIFHAEERCRPDRTRRKNG